MNKAVSLFCAISAFFGLSACAQLANYNHVTPVSGSGAQIGYIDAKQRAIFSAPVYDDQLRGPVLKFCAEPSPDALSALASAGNFGLSSKDKLTLQAALSISETASSIGLRTQSIQLMRDSMFRLCEASLSHNNSPEFWSAFRYFQNSMVTILAVEQLTGVTRAPSALLTTNAAATPNKDLASLSQTLTQSQATLATDQADAVTKANALKTAQGNAAAYLKQNNADTEDKLADDKKAGFAPLKQALADAQSANDTASAKVAADQKQVDAYKAAIASIAPYTLTAGGGAVASPSSDATAQAQATVAVAVQNIVLAQLSGGFLRQTCATLYDKEIALGKAIDPTSKLHQACDTWAMNTAGGSTPALEISQARSGPLIANLQPPSNNLDLVAPGISLPWPAPAPKQAKRYSTRQIRKK